MSIHRRAAKRDANEAEIIKALRRVGAQVVQLSGKGVPDLLVGFRGELFLLEVKMPKTGKLTDDQKEFHAAWAEVVHVVYTPEDALWVIGAVEKENNNG